MDLGILASGAQSISNALAGQAGGSSGPFPNAKWSIEIWDENGPMKGSDMAYSFRWPPTSWNWEQGIRADVSMDLLGKPSIMHLGPGLGRMSFQGSHGVGYSQDGSQSQGYQNRASLKRVFLSFVTLVSEAQAKQVPLPKMVLAIRSGGGTEYRNLEEHVWPIGFPTEERDAARPLEWRYSLSFWVLGKPQEREQEKTPGGDFAEKLTTLQKVVAGIQKAVQFVKKVVKVVRSVLTMAKQLVNVVKAIRYVAKSLVRTIRETITQLRELGDELKAACDLATLSKEIKAELRVIRREIRAIDGALRIAAIKRAMAEKKIRMTLSQEPHPLLMASGKTRTTWKTLAEANRVSDPRTATGVVTYPGLLRPSMAASEEI